MWRQELGSGGKKTQTAGVNLAQTCSRHGKIKQIYYQKENEENDEKETVKGESGYKGQESKKCKEAKIIISETLTAR